MNSLLLLAPAEESRASANSPSDSARDEIRRLQNDAANFYNRSDYPHALEAMQQALKTAEASWGEANTNVMEILDLTAGIYRSQGKYSNALSVCQRTLAIREKLLGTNHPDVARSLFALASLNSDLGNYGAGLQMAQRSLQIREQAFGREHQDVAASLAILAKIYVKLGDYVQGLDALRREFAYWDKHFNVNPYLAVTCLSDMASLNQDLGNYESSLRLYQAVLALYEKLYGADAPILAVCWNNIASVHMAQRNYAEAQAFYKRSLDLKLKILGPGHSDVGLALNNLGDVSKRQGKNLEALDLYQRALSVFEKTLGPTHPDVAIVLSNIASLYRDQGECAKALELFRRSLELSENNLGSDHPRVAALLSNLASVLRCQGQDSEAVKFYLRSLAMVERHLGTAHPEAIAILHNIALVYLDGGDLVRAISIDAEAFRRRRSYLLLQHSGATDKEAFRMIEQDRFSEELFHSLCGSGSAGTAARELGAEHLALNKAMLEEVRSTQAALESAPGTATQKLNQDRQALLVQLDRLPESGLGRSRQAERRNEILDQVQRLDAQLDERLGLAARGWRERDLTIAEIAYRLPADSVLIDLVEFVRFEFTAKTNWWKEQRYAAYLTFPLPKDSTNVVVERFDLGEAPPINKAAEVICRRISAGEYRAKDLAVALERLSELVFVPLAGHLTNVAHVIVCPDGQLSRIPFEMLPLPPFGPQPRYLVEEKTVSYVSSGRDVARLAQPIPKVKANAPVVMGNPDFDLDLLGNSGPPEDRSKSDVQASKSEFDQSLLTSAATGKTRWLSRSYRGIKFAPLPGSETEARGVAKLLGDDCVLRLGRDAREAELKSVVSPRVLHLATHGFFQTDQEFKRTNAKPYLVASADGFLPQRGRAEEEWENPMLRCGIALAGANHAMQFTNAVAEDGLLTGLEASLLNLHGTELVILSACETGAGEVKIGEGVMSLRRAFRIAGAETVLASHWKVSDRATSQLMTEFMRRWRSGEPRAKAWREAQLSLLHSRDFSNPYFWAAFTLTGQWR